MSRFRVSELDPRLVNLEVWPSVAEDAIKDPRLLEQYQMRRNAVKLLILGASRREITEATGIDRLSIIRLFKRCLLIHPDGRIYGFRALLSRTRIMPYRRSAPVAVTTATSKSGASGAFGNLLSRFPDIERELQDYVLKRARRKHGNLSGNRYVHESRIPIKSLHKRFIEACRRHNLETMGQYPFTTKKLAYEALSQYVRKLMEQNWDRGAKARLGADAAKVLRTGDGTDRPVFMPFERVECDAHLIDAIFCILIPSLSDELIPKIVHRLWWIILRDVDTGAILGHHLSMNEECTADDVLQAVRNSLTKWQPRKLSVPTLKYWDGAGFPSSHDPRLVGARWQEFSVDGAMANVSPRVIARMQDVVKVNPIVLPRRIPNDRPFVERLFGVLEELGFHRMPNTTGSNPRDTRRTNPEAAAIKYWIQVEQLADVCDVLAANHNANPHSSLYNRTPLEYLSYRCESENCWPAQVDDSDLPRLLSITKTVRVRGNIYKGRRPYVNFYSARYTSAVLSHAPHLIGKNLQITVEGDIRHMKAFYENGAELGILRAGPPWHRTPHTLPMRRAINSLSHRKRDVFLNQSDPVIAWLEYLESSALKKKAVEPLYLEVRRFFSQYANEIQAPPTTMSGQQQAGARPRQTNTRQPKTTPSVTVNMRLPAPRVAANG
ncbi:hypothetical protein [Tunturiibacter gelidiferens]|uniref:hypothetical protein n=1 Tax=Tunturiibacter gelidiferens TaxID=3069689 RepID=UPI003D9B3C28